ncbi:Crp/Fnr family transcriptional regulator [Streptomyces sp. NPDC002055]|uniref:Crp/Fnr family transcriptional regulator n=1 Tax=Streptomyces sp. NPDC002055 TaxID=3154534 RepID=UPI00332CD480
MSDDFPVGSLLAGLGPEERGELLTLGTGRQYGAGSVLMRQEETAHDVYIVLDGYVKVTAITAEEQLALLAVRSRGDLVGEIGVIDGSPRTATATAAGAVVCRCIGGEAFRAFLARHPAVYDAVTRSVTAKFRSAIRRRLEYVDGSVRARLARVLLEFVTHWGIPAPEGIMIAVGLNQAEIAALVGATERSVNETLAEFRTEGTLSVGYRSVVIHDVEALHKAALGMP